MFSLYVLLTVAGCVGRDRNYFLKRLLRLVCLLRQ